MERQQGKLVKYADGSLEWVTWYEDKGPGRARSFVGAYNVGNHNKSHRRLYQPRTGHSLTQSKDISPASYEAALYNQLIDLAIDSEFRALFNQNRKKKGQQ